MFFFAVFVAGFPSDKRFDLAIINLLAAKGGRLTDYDHDKFGLGLIAQTGAKYGQDLRSAAKVGRSDRSATTHTIVDNCEDGDLIQKVQQQQQL